MDFSSLEHMRKLNKLQHHLSDIDIDIFWEFIINIDGVLLLITLEKTNLFTSIDGWS